MAAIPPEGPALDRLLAAAREARSYRERFQRSHAAPELDAALAGWNALLADTEFAASPADFRASVLNESGMAFDLRFRAAGRDADRVRALELWQDAVAATPADSPNRFKRLNNLAAGLSREHDYSHRRADLDRAADCLRLALDIAAAGRQGRGVTLYNLGNVELSLHAAGQEGALEHAVDHLREAAALAARGTAERVAVLDALTPPLRELYQRTHRVELLNELLASSQEAMRTAVEQPANRSIRLAVLAGDLREMYRRSGRLDHLDTAISCLDHAIELNALGASERASELANLGLLFKTRYEASGSAYDLERAIETLRGAAGRPETDGEMQAGRLSNLATALVARYRLQGAPHDLEEAIGLYRDAVARVPDGSGERALHLDALAYGLIELYRQTGRAEVVDEAIDLCRQALLRLPPGSRDRQLLLNNLATNLKDRYVATGRLEDLDEALRHWNEALNLESDDPAKHAVYLSNMAGGLRAHYGHSRAVEDLNAAVSLLDDALELTPPGGTDLPWRLSNLANALGDRYAATGAIEDLQSSIRAYRRALAAAPASALERPRLLSNMGLGLRDLYRRTDQAELLDEAVELLRQTLQTALPGSPDRAAALLNLGSTLCARYDRGKAPDDLSAAIASYEEAARAGVAPEIVLIASKTWSQWALERDSFAEAARAAGYGLAEVDRLLKAQYRRRHQEDWLFAAQGVAANAAYAWAHAGDPRRAVEVLEASRAYFLSEALERNSRDLDRLARLGHQELLDEYRHASAQWEALTTTVADGRGAGSGQTRGPEATREQLEALRARLDAIVDQVRAVPGYSDFLRAPAFPQIQAAADSAPLVYIVATRAGGLALIVRDAQQDRASPVDVVPLPALTDSALLEQLFGAKRDGPGGYIGAYARRVPGTLTFVRWMNALDGIAEWLWPSVMAPLVAALPASQPAATGRERPVPSAILIPSGLLGLLPLHAAWRADSTSPTGRRYALDYVSWSYAPNARALAAARERSASLSTDQILLVADPQPVTAGALPNALEEAQKIVQLWPEANRASRERATATHKEVTALLPGCTVLHYAGHAFTGWDVPQDGGLLLADDRVLTVRELQEMRLQIRLAVLSACETGVPGARIPDEVIGLPTALVEAGVSGVVASLWSVADATTAQLMEDFYVRWRRADLLNRPAEALRLAQLALRDSGHAHPYYWAAFTYSGT